MDTLSKNKTYHLEMCCLSKSWRRIIGYWDWRIKVLPHLILGNACELCCLQMEATQEWQWFSFWALWFLTFRQSCSCSPSNSTYWLMNWFWKKSLNGEKTPQWNSLLKNWISQICPSVYLIPSQMPSFTGYSLGLVLEWTLNTSPCLYNWVW